MHSHAKHMPQKTDVMSVKQVSAFFLKKCSMRFQRLVCFFLLYSAKSIERGCLSETAKCTNTTHCKICDGDGCNNYMGNSTEIPTAPNSATAWNSATTVALILVPALISLQFTQ